MTLNPPTKTPAISPAQMSEYVEAFELFDKDGDNTISTGELKNLLRCFGQKSTDEEVAAMISLYDKDNTGSIEFESFVVIMNQLSKEEDIDEEIKEVYKVFDRDDKGISAKELSSVMTSLMSLKAKHKNDKGITPNVDNEDDKVFDVITEQDAIDMIAESDMDGDGKLNFEEFARILMEKDEKPRNKYN